MATEGRRSIKQRLIAAVLCSGRDAFNRPFTTGDNLWGLDDRIAQTRFSEGDLTIRVRRLNEDGSFKVDTPNAAITILREGECRFNANQDSATTYVVVRHGEAEVTGGGQAFTVRSGNAAQFPARIN